MLIPVVGFIPPVVGLEGEFNTIRLGGAYAKKLKEGDTVFLMDQKSLMVFGTAIVQRVLLGTLKSMCEEHGSANHTELNNDAVGAPERLFKLVQKIYGPHIANETKKSCVIYMKRLE